MKPERLLALLRDQAAGKSTARAPNEVHPALFDEVAPVADAWAEFVRASQRGEALIAPPELLPPLP